VLNFGMCFGKHCDSAWTLLASATILSKTNSSNVSKKAWKTPRFAGEQHKLSTRVRWTSCPWPPCSQVPWKSYT